MARITAAQNAADIAAIREDVNTLTATLAAFIAAQTPATVVSAPEPKAPKATPEFIVARAKNREGNKTLAAVLRAANVEPKGAAWEAAKAASAAGKTNRAIVAAARKAA